MALTCKAIPIIGMLLGHMTCEQPPAAPTGKAPFCETVRQAGGPLRPSRKDTPESARYMNKLRAAHDADCK